VIANFILFILCIIDNVFTILNQRNTQTCSVDIYITISHWILLRFGPQGTNIRESNQSNTAQNHVSLFWTRLTWWKRVKWLKGRHLFVK